MTASRTDLSVDEPGYEACDDGNEADDDTCLSTCVEAGCSDGIVGPGEGCDDGGADPTDDCADCQPATCGDGIVQAGDAAVAVPTTPTPA